MIKLDPLVSLPPPPPSHREQLSGPEVRVGELVARMRPPPSLKPAALKRTRARNPKWTRGVGQQRVSVHQKERAAYLPGSRTTAVKKNSLTR